MIMYPCNRSSIRKFGPMQIICRLSHVDAKRRLLEIRLRTFFAGSFIRSGKAEELRKEGVKDKGMCDRIFSWAGL